MKRSFRVVVLAVLSLLLLGPVPASLANAPGARVPAGRSGAIPKAIEAAPDVAAGYGTGTVLHADALRSGKDALVGLDVAFSGAAFSSAPASSEYTNEVHRLVAPKLGLKAAFGRGTGLELGLGQTPTPLIGQLAQAAAPPSTNVIEKVIGPLGIPNILKAELLRSQAQSRSAQDGCVLGPNQAYGLGSVLNLEVLRGLVATVAQPPLREVSQSGSTTRIVPGSTPGRLGLRSETRQTIAPVTFFKGTPIQFTVEVLGEWALQATADGAKGSIHYGPLTTSPETPIVRILGSKGQVLGELTTQMLLSNKGLDITIPDVAEIAVGEDPRMIGGDASTAPVVQPTMAVAAADVVRVRLLDGQLADVRIGHMEAAVTVPAGGVQCPGLTVDHTVDKPNVTPGDEFVYTIEVRNPHDCVLTGLKLVETPSAAPSGLKFQLLSSTPNGGKLADGAASYSDIGPLGPGETKTVKVKVKIPSDSAVGALKALAVAQGVCPAELLPTTDVDGPDKPGSPGVGDIPVRGDDSVDGPTVGACTVPDLKDLTEAQAKAALEAAGCALGEVKVGGPGDPADVGKVINQGPPAGNQVPLGTPVDVTLGGPLCIVPSVTGLTVDEARAKLEAAGCKLGDVTDGPPGGPDDGGKITNQTPPAGDKVPTGTEVDVVASPKGCVVPDVSGLSQEEAKAKLEAAGCTLGDVTIGPENPGQTGKVTQQGGPATGTTVPAGTEVDLTVAGPASPTAQVLSETADRGSDSPAPASTLPRTGGVALAGVALWLVVCGLMAQLTGSRRLWSWRRTG